MWAVLAQDFANGVFYRPLLSDAGYGGTRYFPLSFVLHGLLMRAGLPIAASGHLVSVGALAALASGVYALSRRSGVERRLAMGVAGLVVLTLPFQIALTRIAGDALPAALNVWALVLCLPVESAKPKQLAGATVLFVLAFAAKMTTVFGAAAAVIALWLQGRRRASVAVAGASALGFALVLATIHGASAGRFLESVRIINQESGWSLGRGLKLFFARLQTDLPIYLLVLGTLVFGPRSRWRELPMLAFVTTTLATMVIFTSPGTDTNHLIDICAVSVTALGIFLQRAQVRSWLAAGVVGLGGTAALSLLGALGFSYFGTSTDQRPVSQALLGKVGPGPKPLLAQSAWLPLLASEPVVLMDPWNFILAAQVRPELRRHLFEQLRTHAFRAVVLDQALGEYVGTPDDAHPKDALGPGFNDALTGSYVHSAEVDSRHVWIPRTQ